MCRTCFQPVPENIKYISLDQGTSKKKLAYSLLILKLNWKNTCPHSSIHASGCCTADAIHYFVKLRNWKWLTLTQLPWLQYGCRKLALHLKGPPPSQILCHKWGTLDVALLACQCNKKTEQVCCQVQRSSSLCSGHSADSVRLVLWDYLWCHRELRLAE